MTKQKIIATTCIILVLLVCIGGSVALFNPFKSPSEPSGSIDNYTYLKVKKNPITTVKSNSAAKVRLEETTISGDKITRIITSANGSPSAAFCIASINVDLYEYETYIVEFDVFTDVGDDGMLGHFHIAMQNKDKGSNYYLNSSSIRMVDVHLGDTNVGEVFALKVAGSGYQTELGNKFHIEYKFDVNKNNMESSRMRIYIDNYLAFDSAELSEPIFSADARYLYGIKLKEMYTYGGEGYVCLYNLKVKGISR